MTPAHVRAKLKGERDVIEKADPDLGTPHLRFERRGPIAWCTVDRPEARNLISPAMYRGIGHALRYAADDPGLHALVLTGTGDVFIPGGDMGGVDDLPANERLPSGHLPFRTLRQSEVPVVAAVNGICQASGLLFSMLADVSVASERAMFRVPELLRGLTDPWLAAVLPVHVGVGRARELAVTGRRFDAGEALGMGLVTRVVPHDELDAAAEQAAYEVLDAGPLARRYLNAVLDGHYGSVDESILDVAGDNPETLEGFAAFLEKRPATWSVRPR